MRVAKQTSGAILFQASKVEIARAKQKRSLEGRVKQLELAVLELLSNPTPEGREKALRYLGKRSC